MLDFELGLHAESSALLDGEWLALERLDSARRPQVNDNVFATFDLETEREDDTFAGVVGVRDVLALTEAEGGFPLLQRLVVLVCSRSVRIGRVRWAVRLTQLLVLIDGLLLADLEALGLLGVQFVVVVRHVAV